MTRRLKIGIAVLVVVGMGSPKAQVPVDTQPNQETLVEQIGSNQSRYAALSEIRAMPPESVGPELRDQLIAELQRTNELRRLSQSTSIGFASLEAPAYVYELHRVVAALKDPKSIPALANALGSSTIIDYMVEWGEQAAPAVLDVVMVRANPYEAVDDGLRILRMMVENQAAQRLSVETLARIRDAALQRLTEPQFFTTVWYAIDLAAVLEDPDLERKLELIATYPADVAALGVDESRIEKTQQRAAERLAGVPAQPRIEDFPDR